MRRILVGLVVFGSLSMGSASFADVGPPPACPEGTHHEYLRGHRCVRDGYMLQVGDDGTVTEVPGPQVETREAPLPVTPATVTPPPAKRGGCAIADGAQSAT